ncbi:MAG: branched-chain amino acid ABC transporter substrate-binding protein [Thermodesulfobacteriota bacterium]
MIFFNSAIRMVLLIGLSVFLISACDKPKPVFECTDPIGCVEIGPGEPIHIGVLQALSGNVAALGKEQLRGFELALDKRGGTLLGHSVALRVKDTGCTAEGGANAALKIIADPQMVAILGTTCSGAAATASKAMSDAGLTMISGNNSAPYLTAIAGKPASHWQPGYFRTAANEESAGKAAAIFAYQRLGVRKAATIHDGDIYTRGLTEGFENAFQEMGGEIVLSAAVNKGDTEMQPVLTAVLDAGAGLLFFPLFQPEGNHLLFTARTTPGLDDIFLMSDGALIESSFIESVGEAGIGMYFVGPASPEGSAADSLAMVYVSKFGTRPGASYFHNAYDAADLLMTAIEAVAVPGPDGRLHIGRQALRDRLYAVDDFEGVTGVLDCDRFGDCALPVFDVLRLDDPAAGLEGLVSNIMFTHVAVE